MKVTSGGIESAARPIYECRGIDEEKDRVETGKAGRRKDGNEIEGVEVIVLWRPLDRAVENIVVLLRGLKILLKFGGLSFSTIEI